MKWNRKLLSKRFLFTSICLFACTAAFAHIKNEASQFPDIEFSDARFDIVVLVGAGIIPETPVFEPDKPLSKRELATWVALAQGLAAGGETPDTGELARAAEEAGLLASLAGNASYADVNALFFQGEESPEEPTATPSKADAATFIASRLNTEAGRALLERRGLRAGMTGQVTEVVPAEGHNGGNSYLITINGTTRPMHLHGRVANGPVDLLQWEGRTVRRSFVEGEGEHIVWSYLEAETLDRPTATGTGSRAAVAVENKEQTTGRILLYWLTAGALVLGLLLFFRRRRSG